MLCGIYQRQLHHLTLYLSLQHTQKNLAFFTLKPKSSTQLHQTATEKIITSSREEIKEQNPKSDQGKLHDERDKNADSTSLLFYCFLKLPHTTDPNKPVP